jgi:hypothetical protein
MIAAAVLELARFVADQAHVHQLIQVGPDRLVFVRDEFQRGQPPLQVEQDLLNKRILDPNLHITFA